VIDCFGLIPAEPITGRSPSSVHEPAAASIWTGADCSTSTRGSAMAGKTLVAGTYSESNAGEDPTGEGAVSSGNRVGNKLEGRS
jgi:hypothetical protein